MAHAHRSLDDRCMRSHLRRPILLTLAAILVTALAPMATVTAATTLTSSELTAAEKSVMTLVNRQRANLGLVALKWDRRIADLARERSQYMAETGRFSHQEADGSDVFDKIASSRITWYSAGEIIAWNNAEGLDYSAAFAVQGWMKSPSHREIIVSKGYNYVGFGLAIAPDGKRYWTGVFMRGPDRTAGWTKFEMVAKRVYDSRRTKVFVRWDGGDTRLQVLTAGLRYYETARRVNGGSWVSYGTTTGESTTRYWPRGSTIDFRVRVRDRAGNWSAWKMVTVRL